jgi:predicted PurR-regulated permease PerM
VVEEVPAHLGALVDNKTRANDEMAEMYEATEEKQERAASRQWPAVPLFQPGRWWWLASAIAVGIFLGLGSLELLSLLAEVLGVIFLGATLAAALSPIVEWLAHFLPRVVSVILVYVVIIAIIMGLGWIVLPRLWGEAREAGVEVPALIEQAQGWMEQVVGEDVGATGLLSTLASNAGTALTTIPNAVISIASALLVALFISFYWLILQRDIKDSFLSLFPEPRRQQMQDVLAQGASSMGGYLRGVMIDSAILAVAAYAGLSLIGVEYALVLAVLVGLLEIVPMIGATLSFFIVSAFAFLQGTTTGLYTAGLMFVLQQIENEVLAPYVMSSQTDASPLLILIAVFTGGAIGGFIGVLIAIPLAAFLQVLFREMLAPAFRKHAGAPPVEDDDEGGEEVAGPDEGGPDRQD